MSRPVGVIVIVAVLLFVVVLQFVYTKPPSTDTAYVTTTLKKEIPHDRKFVFVSVWTHYPAMLQWQYAAIAHFCRDDFVFLIVDGSGSSNSKPRKVSKEIKKTVGGLEFGHYFKPATPKNETLRTLIESSVSFNHAYNVQAATDHILSSGTIGERDVLFHIDSDMFLLDFISFSDFTSSSGFTSNIRVNHGIEFLWPNLCIIDLLILGRTAGVEQDGQVPLSLSLLQELDFSPGQLTPTLMHPTADSGGLTALLWRKYPSLGAIAGLGATECAGAVDGSFLQSQCMSEEALPARCVQPEFFQIQGREVIYHLKSAGSNWRRCSEKFLVKRRNGLIARLKALGVRDSSTLYKEALNRQRLQR